MLSTLLGLAPILFLFFFPLLSSLFSGGGTTAAGPRIVFDVPEPPTYVMERVTPKLKVKYYINPADVRDYSKGQLNKLDTNAEHGLLKHLRVECEAEMMHKQRLYDEAQGWFTQDPKKMDIAHSYTPMSCRRLERMGVPIR